MIAIYRKNPWGRLVKCQDEDGVIVDLSGYNVKYVVKRENDYSNVDDFALVNKNFDIVDGSTGSFVVELTSEDTNINPGNYKFEIQISKDGSITTLHQDTLIIKETYINE